MSREVTATAPAKVNLSLGVGPVRDDGYHPLATVYQAVGVYDDVTVRSADRTTVSVTGEGVDVSDVPDDETNLALRAALLLAARHGIGDGVQMSIRKRIPVAGGLAGGSTDAAAALVACDALWGTRTPREEMAAIAARVGSDVPFCLVGGTAVGSGRGEAVTPAMTRGGYWWVLAVADDGLSTPAVYREFDRMHARVPAPDPEIPDPLMAALRAGDVEKLGRSLSNDLQRAAFRLRPELEELVGRGLEATAHGALVSGSGPTCLFLAESEAHAAQVRDRLAGSVPRLLCAPAPVHGAHVIR
jgi:4-diphosphocytidyl-2-C-methyl-D-erythritol kinase